MRKAWAHFHLGSRQLSPFDPAAWLSSRGGGGGSSSEAPDSGVAAGSASLT